MTEQDGRIHILWIDDCEAADAKQYAFPEAELPPDLQEWFRIVRHSDIPGPSSIRTPGDFWKLFEGFWVRGETDLLPVEIVAMDYNLRKWRDPGARKSESVRDDDDGMGNDEASGTVELVDDANEVTGGKERRGFEGLVTGVFVGAMLSPHPTGLVPMTNYGDELGDIPEVRALHSLSTPILRVDYSEFHVADEGRSWHNVLCKGVAALRDRMEMLFLDGDVSLSFADLMNLSEGTGEHLLVRSRYCERRLPVQGLFLDVSDWRSAAKAWSIDLIRDMIREDSLDALVGSRKLGEALWNAYNDEEAFSRRLRLSTLHAARDTLDDETRRELDELYSLFGVANPDSPKASCSRNTADLRGTGADGQTLRWTCLQVLLKLLARYVRCHKNWASTNGEHCRALNVPAVTTEDWMIAMFPIAQTPIVLPFEQGASADYAATAWGKWLRDNLRGEYALNPRHVLEGYGQGEKAEDGRTVTRGLRAAERSMLREMARDEPGLSKEDWQALKLTKNVLWGKPSS